jgi:hypothetical protein
MLPIKTQAKRIPQAPVVPPPSMIVLEMREEVAETLRIVVGNVAGHASGRRGHTDEVYEALKIAGVRSLPPQCQDREGDRTYISFGKTVSRY